MAIKVETVTLPAFLASALVNGDESGLEDSDMDCLNRVYEWLDKSKLTVVDVARDDDGNAMEPRFTWSFRLHFGDASGGDVLDYVCHSYE